MKNKKKTILVIEDEESMSQILEERLTLEGYEVLTAFDGEKGIEIALEKHPDLILLDIVMPNMNGAEALQKLVSDKWGKKASVVCLTNLIDVPESVQKIMREHEMIDYIVKVNTQLDSIVTHVKQRLGDI